MGDRGRSDGLMWKEGKSVPFERSEELEQLEAAIIAACLQDLGPLSELSDEHPKIAVEARKVLEQWAESYDLIRATL
jgi:hypothetical protein